MAAAAAAALERTTSTGYLWRTATTLPCTVCTYSCRICTTTLRKTQYVCLFLVFHHNHNYRRGVKYFETNLGERSRSRIDRLFMKYRISSFVAFEKNNLASNIQRSLTEYRGRLFGIPGLYRERKSRFQRSLRHGRQGLHTTFLSPAPSATLSHSFSNWQDFYRQHMLSDTLLVPRLVLPYLDQCVRQARLLCHR